MFPPLEFNNLKNEFHHSTCGEETKKQSWELTIKQWTDCWLGFLELSAESSNNNACLTRLKKGE